MSTTRRGCDGLLPRRRFLQALCVAAAIGRPGVTTPVRPGTHASTTLVDDGVDDVVEYRGWIVRASDRARLGAGALQ